MFLLPIFGLLETQANNLQSIGSQMKNWKNRAELTDLINSTLKIAAPGFKSLATELIDALANLKASREGIRPILVTDKLLNLPVFSKHEFLQVLPQRQRQKYFVMGIMSFMELLSNDSLFSFARNKVKQR